MYRADSTSTVVDSFFCQEEDGIRDAQESRGLEDVYKGQLYSCGPILAIVSIVLPIAFWHAWQAHPSLG